MTNVPIHPADDHLARLTPSMAQVPANRALAIRNAFREHCGSSVDLLSGEELSQRIVQWLEDSVTPRPQLMLPRKDGSRRSVHPTLAHKALWLQNQECRICDVHLGLSVPVRFGIRINPFSAQSRKKGQLKARKAAVRDQLLGNRAVAQHWPADRPVCMQITVLERRAHSKDVDNMVKGILDALQGVLYENDAAVHHLNVVKLTHDLPQGFYLVNARPARSLADDIIDAGSCTPNWKQATIDI